MKTYAFIQNDIVHEIILPAVYTADMPDWTEGEPSRIGLEIPIEERFVPEWIPLMIDITDMTPQPKEGWTYDRLVFAPPYVAPIDYEALNSATRDSLSTQASQAMVPYFLATNLGNATDKETLAAKAWQSYYRALQLVDLTLPAPAWPAPPAQ